MKRIDNFEEIKGKANKRIEKATKNELLNLAEKYNNCYIGIENLNNEEEIEDILTLFKLLGKY